MGISLNKTLIVWIDKNVNSSDNKRHQNKFKENENTELKCFESIHDGINFLKNRAFQRIIIIVSGRLYQEFIKYFKECLREEKMGINFIPRIIIFTGKTQNFIDFNKNNTELPLNDPFYNLGGIKDKEREIMSFIESSINEYNNEFKPNKDDFLHNETLQFLNIRDKKEIILPLDYTNFLKISTEEQIKTFNQKMFSEYRGVIPLEFFFSQLSESGNIPDRILSYFWLRAYSSHNSFSINMNKQLLKGEYNDYLPIIQKLYEANKKGQIQPENSELYKGIIVEKNENDDGWKYFIDNFKEGDGNCPKAIIYGPSFFSFYTNKNRLDEYKKNEKLTITRNELFISLVLKPANFRFIPNQTIIKKELSYFDTGDEVLFFPFSCFEVSKIEHSKKEENEYTIYLNYLDEDKYFKSEEKRTTEEIPKNSYSQLVFNSGIINIGLIKVPNWFELSNNISKFLNYQPNPFYQPNPVHNNNNNLGNIINSVNNQNNYNNINNNYNSINNNNIINNNYNNNNNNNFNNINNNNFNNINNNNYNNNNNNINNNNNFNNINNNNYNNNNNNINNNNFNNINNNNYNNNNNNINNNNNFNNINANNYNNINNNNINNNNNFNNINNNNFNNFNNNININNNQPILSIQKGISNYNLLLEVKEICFQSIISNNWTNYIQISNIIKNNLIQVFNCNWWILVGDNISFSYNNIDPNLVMIFHFSYLNFNFYIHVSQI